MGSTDPRPPAASLRTRIALPPAALVFLLQSASLLGADVYGKPLRGLTLVPVRVAVKEPERFSGREIRVAGQNAGPEGRPELREGDAVLPILTDTTFALPKRLDGVALAAEGSLRKNDGVVVFVASGVEVTR